MEKDQVIEIARKVFSEGNQVLVVAVIPSNMGKWWELKDRDTRLQFLDTREDRRWHVPKRTRLVLATDFKSHSALDHLRGEFARLNKEVKDAVWAPGLFSPGEIQAILEASYTPLDKKSTKENDMPQDLSTAKSAAEPRELTASAELLEEFQTNMELATEALKDVLVENKTLREAQAKHDEELAASKERVRGLEVELETHKNFVSGLEEDQEELEADLATSKQRASDLEASLTTLRADLTQANTKLAEAERKLKTFKDFLSTL